MSDSRGSDPADRPGAADDSGGPEPARGGGSADESSPGADGSSAHAPGGSAADPDAPYVRLAVVALIHRARDDRWLLVRPPRLYGVWAPPGGRVERGESLEGALRREMREELGVELDVVGPCYAYVTMHKGERVAAISMACGVRGERAVLRLDPAEATASTWVTVQEWVALASEGRTLWTAPDILKATTAARALVTLETRRPVMDRADRRPENDG